MGWIIVGIVYLLLVGLVLVWNYNAHRNDRRGSQRE